MTIQRTINKAFIALTLGVLISSCGYFKDDPVKESVVDARNLVGTCEINIEKLKNILVEEITEEIDCLEQNISTYREFVILENRDIIGREELKAFVSQYFDTDVDELTNSIDLAFTLSSLVLNDSEDGVSVNNIGPFFNVIRITNKALGKFNKVVNDYDSNITSLIDSRKAVRDLIQVFTDEVRSIISVRGRTSGVKFDISRFIVKLQTSYNVLQTLNINTINGLLGFKKLLLGGEAGFLTRPEFFIALDKLPDFGKVLFSIVKGERASFIEENDYLIMLREGITSIEAQLFENHRQNEKILDKSLLEGLIDYLAANKEDAKRYKLLANSARRNLLNDGKDEDVITYKEIRNTIVFAKSFLDANLFYSKYKKIVENNKMWDNDEWKKAQRAFGAEVELLQSKLIDSFSSAFYLPQHFYLMDFIREGLVITENEDLEIVKYLDLVGKAKIVIVGGDDKSLTRNQLGEFINKSKLAAESAFNIWFLSDKSHNVRQKRKIYFDVVKSTKTLVTSQSDTQVVTMTSLVDELQVLLKTDELKGMIPSLNYIKEKVIGGDRSLFRVRDFNRLFEMAEKLTSILYYMDISYDLYADSLSYGRRLTRLADRDHPHYKDFSETERTALQKRFEDIVFKFRIYREESGVQYYTNEYKRSKHGLIELAYVKYIIEELLKGFGSYDNNIKEHTINMDQMKFSLNELQSILEYLGLWSETPDTFAQNIVLLSDLFQGRSDGSVSIDSFEGTEFMTLLFFAQDFTEKFIPFMNKRCPQITRKGVTGYDLTCYRREFYTVLLRDTKMRQPLAKLSKYAMETSRNNPSEFSEFHIAVEGFARDVNDPEVPMTKKDTVLLFGALLNIESVFIRYDRDFDNILKYPELRTAFPVYEEALILISDGLLNDDNREYASTVFYYIIDRKVIPTSQIVVGAYELRKLYKNINADRLNIGKLLFNMVQQ